MPKHVPVLILAIVTSLVHGQVNLGGTVVAKENIVVYLMFGHSNMVTNRASDANDTQTHPHLWNYKIPGGWTPAKNQIHDPNCSSTSDGPTMFFLKEMQKRYPDTWFGVVNNSECCAGLVKACGCQGSDELYKKGGKLYNEIVARAKELKGKVTFGGIFCDLGFCDADKGVSSSAYAGALKEMAEGMRAELGAGYGGKAIPFLPLKSLRSAPGNGTVTACSQLSRAVAVRKSSNLADSHHNGPAGQKENAINTAKVIASNGFDEWKNYSSGPPDTEAPTAPAALKVTNTTSTTVGLSWTAATDNRGAIAEYLAFHDGTQQVGTLSGSATSGVVSGLSPASDYRITLKAKDGAGNISAPSNAVNARTGDVSYAALPLKINCGGSASGGFLADRPWDGTWGFARRDNATSAPITGTSNDAMYGSVAHMAYVYRVFLPDGDYRVTLHFAEMWRDAAGQRVFTVKINGSPAPVDPIDIVKAVGKNEPYDVATPLNVSGSQVLIESVADVGGPILSGITIAETDGNAPGQTSLTISSPGEGGAYTAGETMNIAWTSPEPLNVNLVVDVSLDGGKTWTQIVDQGLPEGTQSYDWTIPAEIEVYDPSAGKLVPKLTATDNAIIMVYEYDNQENVKGLSGTFTISPLNAVATGPVPGHRDAARLRRRRTLSPAPGAVKVYDLRGRTVSMPLADRRGAGTKQFGQPSVRIVEEARPAPRQ